MFDIDYEQLIKEKRVYFVTYGRGGIVGVVDNSIDDYSNNMIMMIRDTHGQEPQIITKLEMLDDSLIIELESEHDYESSKKVRIQKKIPLYQITFEKYESIDK